VWLRRLATDRLIRNRSPAPADDPLVIAEPVKAARRLSAVNDAAARRGLKPGMALADARAMYPALAVVDADPAADARMLERIVDWCDRYTPLVGLHPPDGLVLDITGCAHLFGGEAALARDIIARLAAQGLHARVAAADTVGCAWAAARYADCSSYHFSSSEDDAYADAQLSRRSATASPPPERGRDRVGVREQAESSCAIVPSSQTQAVLLPLPLAALRIAPETVANLAQVGLKRIADVIDRPRAPLAARFGEDFVRRLDQALGREDEPIAPRLPVPPYVVERRFAEPIAREADVLGTIAHLAHELVRLLERRGEGARVIEVALFRTDGKVFRLAAGAAAPLSDASRMHALFVERLAAIGDEWDPGFGFDVVRLGVLSAERCDPVQTGLAAPDRDAELAHLVDRLGARFGLRRVTRLMPQDTHIPEFAVTAATAVAAGALEHVIPAEAEGREPGPMVRRARTVGSRIGSLRSPSGMTTERICEQDSLAPVRPVRLFERPEPIEAIAEVPDGPPAQFVWRRVRHLVAHAEGPERIAMQWWRDEQGRALTRDYFRIESREGVRMWLYREGLYGHESGPCRWFLHGLFA
jgi:protein ImuB